MRKIWFAILFIFLFVRPSHAFLEVAFEAAEKAREIAYQNFMQLKAVQQLKTLRDNYVAGKEYYEMAKKLNEGRGLAANIKDRLMDIGDEESKKIQKQFEDDWIVSRPTNTLVDQWVDKGKKYIQDKIDYAEKVFK